MSSLRFHVADYVVFALTLLISCGIGVYHAIKSKPSTTNEYLLASRKMQSVPVAMSLLASFMSGVTILGVPSEVYTFGIQYGLMLLAYVLLFPTIALVFVPTIYDLGLTSSYEYLERRFSFGVRIIAAVTFTFYTLFYMAIATYGPSIALQSVTGLPVWVSILTIGVVCTFYTSIGGIRAVIWNDVFQVIVMFGGLVTIVVVGTIEVGGPSRVVSILKENDRAHVSFSFDPRERTTFWALFFGVAFALLPQWSVNQTAVQRYLSAKSLKDAQKSVWIAWPINMLGVSLCIICGAVIFAYYAGCDPKMRKVITSNDQLVPYFALDVIGHLHGLPGVFLACLFSGTLSTLSSGLNSLAAIFLEDFMKPLSFRWNYNISDAKLTQLSKYIAALFGFITIGLSFLVGSLGTIIQASYSVAGIMGAPIVAAYSMGMLTRFANKKGVYIGLASGFSFGLLLAIGTQIHRPPRSFPAVSVGQCSEANVTRSFPKKVLPVKKYEGLDIYKMSPFWYSFYCFFITFFVGLLVSFLWRDDEQRVDERLIINFKRLFNGETAETLELQDVPEKPIELHDKKFVGSNDVKQTEEKANDDPIVVFSKTQHFPMSTHL